MRLILYTIAIALIIPFSQAQSATLLSLWEFDGDYTSSTGPDYQGQPNGTPTFIPGVVGQALEFDFSTGPADSPDIDYVDSLATPSNSQFNSGFSIMAWIRPTAVGSQIITHSSSLGSSNQRGFVLKWINAQESSATGLPEGAIRLTMHDGTDTGALTSTSTEAAVAVDSWTHIAVTWNGSVSGGVRFYKNGLPISDLIEIEPSGFQGLTSTGAIPIRIGSSHADSGNNIFSFGGALDHVSIWLGPLTDQDVLNDYLGTSGPADGNTIVSSFETGTEGWVVRSSNGPNLQRVLDGGNPGAYILIDSPAEEESLYFSAPAKFLGDKSSYFDGCLQFELRTDIAPPNSHGPLVRLIGESLALDYERPAPLPSGQWIPIIIPLKATPHWQVNGLPAKDTDVQAVLGSLHQVLVDARLVTGQFNVTALDSVSFSPFCPPSLLTIRVSQVEICWNTIPDRLYTLQYRSSFTGGAWSNLASEVIGDGFMKCFTDDVIFGETEKYYQLQEAK